MIDATHLGVALAVFAFVVAIIAWAIGYMQGFRRGRIAEREDWYMKLRGNARED